VNVVKASASQKLPVCRSTSVVPALEYSCCFTMLEMTRRPFVSIWGHHHLNPKANVGMASCFALDIDDGHGNQSSKASDMECRFLLGETTVAPKHERSDRGPHNALHLPAPFPDCHSPAGMAAACPPGHNSALWTATAADSQCGSLYPVPPSSAGRVDFQMPASTYPGVV
jgi:hypothetical protein